MRWTVDWVAEAEDDPAAAYMASLDPAAVTAAQAQIDRLLARDPVGNGRPLSEGLHQIVETPLTAFYEIDDAARRVTVARVWHTP